jgi:hypothetical protein
MVRRALASSLLSLLLVATLVGGGCISCEQYFMFGGGAKNCCAPDGHCKSKAPGQKTPARACNQIAFDHHRHADLSLCPPVPVIASILPADFTPERAPMPRTEFRPSEASPPDLQILHSTFLI